MTQPKLPEDLNAHQKLCDAAYQAGAYSYQIGASNDFIKWAESYVPPTLLPVWGNGAPYLKMCYDGGSLTTEQQSACRLVKLLDDCFQRGYADGATKEWKEGEAEAEANDNTGLLVGAGVVFAGLLGLLYLGKKRI